MRDELLFFVQIARVRVFAVKNVCAEQAEADVKSFHLTQKLFSSASFTFLTFVLY